MTIVTVTPPKGSENNPIDQEVVKRAAIQLSKIRYNKLKEEIEKLTCQEHPNEKTSITINMNKDGDSKSIIACCEAFKVTVETAIYEIKNI